MSIRRDFRFSTVAASLAVLTLVGGCVVRPVVEMTPTTPAKKPAEPSKPRVELIGRRAACESTILGRSVEDRPIEARVFGRGADTVLLLATIHGNESAGTPLLQRLAKHLSTSPALLNGRRVILIPLTNPDGFSRKSRFNANRVDVNRNFPAENRQGLRRYGSEALSEPEARVIATAIRRFRPNRIITIHQPATCVDYDGPAADLALVMARAGKLRVKRLGTKPGSLGSYAGVGLGIPVVTVELPGGATHMNPDKRWASFGPMLLTAIEYPTK